MCLMALTKAKRWRSCPHFARVSCGCGCDCDGLFQLGFLDGMTLFHSDEPVTGTAVRLPIEQHCGSTGLQQGLCFNWPVTDTAALLACDRHCGSTGLHGTANFQTGL